MSRVLPGGLGSLLYGLPKLGRLDARVEDFRGLLHYPRDFFRHLHSALLIVPGELAQKANLAPNTVSRFENGSGARVDTLAQIQEALEKEGVIFVPADDSGGPGVRLKRARPRDG